MLPDYMPAAHPLLVHFPIALLTAGVVVELVAALVPAPDERRGMLRRVGGGTLLLGALLLPLTYWTGTLASDAVASPFVQADVLVSEHSDWAWWTMWLFLGLAAMRLGTAAIGKLGRGLHVVLALIGIVGLGLLWQTAERGGRLVYDLGVGVRAVREAPEGAFEPEPEPDPAELGPTRGEDGGLRWRFRPGAEEILTSHLEAISGTIPEAMVETRQAALVLQPRPGRPSLLALGERHGDVNVRASVNLTGFSGRIGLLHHLDGEDYGFLLVDSGRLRLGRRVGGQEEIFDEVALEIADGWHELEVVAAGDHFRGYLDGELRVHGHGPAREPGRVGLLIDGDGELRIDDLRVRPLQEGEG